MQQVMTVSACAGTSSPHLDPETVAQDFHYQVIMDIIEIKRNDSKPVTRVIGKDMETVDGLQFPEGNCEKFLFPLADHGNTHLVFEVYCKGCPDSLQEAWRASILTDFNIVDEFVFSPWIGPVNRTASGLVGSRAGIKGIAVTLLCEDEFHHMKLIEKRMGRKPVYIDSANITFNQ